MSEPLIKPNPMLKLLQDNNTRLKQTETKEIPPLWLPYAQRALNPLAATAAAGDFAQPWPILAQVFYVTVFVQTTNNGTNFWTIDLQDTTGTVVATVNTSAIAAGTWARLSDTTVTASATTNAELSVICTKTLAPGNLFVIPALSVLRI